MAALDGWHPVRPFHLEPVRGVTIYAWRLRIWMRFACLSATTGKLVETGHTAIFAEVLSGGVPQA